MGCTMIATTLHTRFRQLAHRLLAVGLASGLGWGLAAGLLVLLNAVWLDLLWELPPRLRLIGWMVALAAAVLLVAGAAWWAWRRGAAAALAKRLDFVAGTGGQIRSGVDL